MSIGSDMDIGSSPSGLDDSCLGWIYKNRMKTERGDLVEFDEHYFLLEPFANWHWKQCCMKSAQIGFSTLSILKSFYGLSKRNYNCIYTLPTFEDVHDFVPAKVDGMISNNQILTKLLGKSDAVTKKQIGNNFIWYRGTHGTKAAIMHTSDLNIYDEMDASNLATIDMYGSRLQKSKYKGEWMFSNPIRPGGIDQKYEMSDKRRWMITCSRCNHTQVLDYYKNVCKERKIYVCQGCDQELREEDRRVGAWVAEHPGREVHGYHINQLMAKWVTAKELVYLEDTKTPQYFHNMILGLPYVDKDEVVDAELIRQNLVIRQNSMMRNAMGVDVKYRELHYVLGNHEGIFKVGICKGEHIWADLEQIIKKYRPLTVIDMNPDPYPRRRLVPKYPGRVFVCSYKQDPTRRRLIDWGKKETNRGNVYVDRNQMISSLIYDFIDGKIKFNTAGKLAHSYIQEKLKEYIEHWEHIYKITEEDRNGIPFSSWKKSGPDDFVHATAYFKIALTKVPELEEDEVDESRVGAAITILDDTIPADKIPILEDDSWLDSESWKYV